jgi:DNA repair protein RadA/Sms
MVKKTQYVCQECGYDSPKWFGRCPGCGAWNALVEEIAPTTRSRRLSLKASEPTAITDVTLESWPRMTTGIAEFDRVLGGGIVKGSVVLLSGDPGIGKSTLVMQATHAIASKGSKVLYVSGEESAQQTKLRAQRIGAADQDNLLVVTETDIDLIMENLETLKPNVAIVDSIQTTYSSELSSAPGSVGQVRECGARFLRTAKAGGTTIFLVGHVTKRGVVAGPRTLEHLVDTVLYLEGDLHHQFRVLRTTKNRFGSTNEIGVFEMSERGLLEVDNPSRVLLEERSVNAPGSAVVATMEGTRPLLVEVQALVSPATYGMPQRVATGTDYKRLSMLLAVLERRVGMRIGNHDIFVNIVGGIRIDEPAIDLGEICVIASSLKNQPIDSATVLIGEVGLSGEVRAVSQLERRLQEAQKLGFTRCIVPHHNLKGRRMPMDIKCVDVKEVSEALRALL